MILSPSFFAHYMSEKEVDSYRKSLSLNTFTCMELSGQSYPDTVGMPVKKFYDYLKWKTDLEEEKNKLIKEHREK